MLQTVGPIILDLIGTELDQEEYELLQHPLVGGVILFSRNYATPEQLMELCQSIRKAKNAPILIVVDQEGGRVQRFREGFTAIPSMGSIGLVYEHSKQNALTLANTCGWLMAAELLSVGIDLSLAPVLDLNKMTNPAVGNRSFHRNPQYVIDLASALINGMQSAGMAAVGKHFPGHGGVELDTHVGLPTDKRLFDEIEADDLQPFMALIRSGMNGLMPAHIIFPEVDKNPAVFSPHWLQTILRKQYQFSGIIFSDDLNMKGADSIGDYATRAEQALKSGCDMILICNNRPAAIQILTHLANAYQIDEARLKPLRGRFSLSYNALRQSAEWQEKITQLQSLSNIDVSIDE